MLVSDPSDIPAVTKPLFQSVCDSMLTLFGVMNGQDWNQIEPLLEKEPWTKPIFVIFTIYSSWALLSVMTGVVSQYMLDVRVSQEQKDEEAQEEKREKLR